MLRLSEVRHQPRALAIIRRSLSSGRTHHAYLFEGPEGVGKETLACALAARLLCDATAPVPTERGPGRGASPADDQPPDSPADSPGSDACGRCRSCQLLAAGNHPDFHLIHRGLHKQHPDATIRASKGLFIAVEVIRHFLIEPAVNAPSLGRRRVFLIRDAQRMNEQAQNALLKTLEEPPRRACMILVTSSASRLRPTIRSRCQRVTFDLLPPDFVENQLSARARLSHPAAHTLAALAQGRLGVALWWQRIELLAALAQVHDCLAQGIEADPLGFAGRIVEIAAELARRAIELGQADLKTVAALANPAANGRPAPPKATSKDIPADELRAALKLVLMLIAAVYRDALVLQSGGSAAGCHLPAASDAVQRCQRAQSLEQLQAAIEAVAAAEQRLDRNVAPQLACEHLALALAGELTAGR